MRVGAGFGKEIIILPRGYHCVDGLALTEINIIMAAFL